MDSDPYWSNVCLIVIARGLLAHVADSRLGSKCNKCPCYLRA